MAERCDRCGLISRGEEQFAAWRLPLLRARHYCPSCSKRFHSGIAVVVLLMMFAGATLAAVEGLLGETMWLHTAVFWLPFFILLLLAVIVPHEFGHALAARWLGYKQIRIVVGLGQPLFTTYVLGFPCVFNLLPLAGFTLAQAGGLPNRWRHLTLIAAGPVVNLALLALAWRLLGSAALNGYVRAVAALFVGLNVLVLIQNLIPLKIRTPFGLHDNDGLQLCKVLFCWERHPANQLRMGITLSAEQRELVKNAERAFTNQNWAEAEVLLGRIKNSLPEAAAVGHPNLFLVMIHCLLSQGDPDRAEQVCMDFLKLEPPQEEGTKLLDGTASYILYQQRTEWLGRAEKLARRALELAPCTPTLEGTLGGVLAEQGKSEEAEPLLQSCLGRSSALHDQGIASLYLGVLASRRGKTREAGKLLKKAKSLHPVPWLLDKANAELLKLDAAGPGRL